jgi:hypothetical protein
MSKPKHKRKGKKQPKTSDSLDYSIAFWEGALDEQDEIDHFVREAAPRCGQSSDEAAGVEATMTNSNELDTPWSLHFDRDGTEDYGIICDAEMNDLVTSHVCGKDDLGKGTFWLPEEEGDPIPQLVKQMQVMTAAPKLLAACRLVVERWEKGDLAEAVRQCAEAVTEATSDSKKVRP